VKRYLVRLAPGFHFTPRAPLPLRIARLAATGMLAVLLVGCASRPSPYYVLRPGSVVEIGPKISLPADRRQESGWLGLTAVRLGRASYVGWLQAQLDPDAQLVASSRVSPPNLSDGEYYTVLARRTETSRTIATVVALRAAGYSAEIGTRGLLVENVQPDAPAVGLLRPGDVILRIDGQPVTSNAERDQVLRQHGADPAYQLDVWRAGGRLTLILDNLAGSERASPLAGIWTSSHLSDLELPFPVDFADDGTLGGSAGLMASLALFDALTPGELATGQRVAGTGTLALDGRVGPVGGVEQKVQAAEQHGVAVFLVPRENAEEAQQAARRLRVIPISSFDEALTALQSLASADPS
jgi:PDZ domain-containing protein